MIIQKALLGDFYVRRTIGKNVVNKHNVMQNLKITKQKKPKQTKNQKKPQKTTQTSLKEKLIILIKSSFDKDYKRLYSASFHSFSNLQVCVYILARKILDTQTQYQ